MANHGLSVARILLVGPSLVGAVLNYTQYRSEICSGEALMGGAPFAACSCVSTQGLDMVRRSEMYIPHANGTVTKIYYNSTDCSGCKICEEAMKNGVCYRSAISASAMWTWDNSNTADTGCTAARTTASVCPGPAPACTCGQREEVGNGRTPSSACQVVSPPPGNNNNNNNNNDCQQSSGSTTGDYLTYTQFRQSPCCSGTEVSGAAAEMRVSPCGCSTHSNSTHSWGEKVVPDSALAGRIEYYASTSCSGCKVCEDPIGNDVCTQKSGWSDKKYRWSTTSVCSSSGSWCAGAEGRVCEPEWMALTTITTTTTDAGSVSHASGPGARSVAPLAALVTIAALV